MAQIFSAQASVTADDIALPNGTPAVVVTLPGLTPPFGNFKAVIDGIVTINLAADNDAYGWLLLRNPDAENVQVAAVELSIVAATLNSIVLAVFGVDVVPDGRECIYQLQAIVAGGAGAGTALTGAGLRATAISG